MEDMLWRFPHIGEQVFKKLSNRNLAKCRKVARTWERFNANQRFYKQREPFNIYVNRILTFFDHPPTPSK